VTVDELIQKIPIVAENYIVAAAEHPVLFMEAARYRVAKMRDVAKITALTESIESKAALRIRNSRDFEDGKKPTEGFVKDSLNANVKVKQARLARDRAHAEEELSKLILEGFRHRRDALRIIADAQHIEGMKMSHETDKMQVRDKAREAALRADEARRRLAIDDDDIPY
jgi:hypothetical protein